MSGATSPIGGVPAFYALGYENEAGEPLRSQWPELPSMLATSACNVGTISTNSANTAAVSTYGSYTTCAFQIAPMAMEADVVWKEIEFPIFAASANGTGSITAAHMLGIYGLSTTANTGGSGTCLTALTTAMWQMVASQNSVTAISAKWWWGTNTASNTESTGGNLAADVEGALNIHMLNGTDSYLLGQGNYWVVHGFSNSTVGANAVKVDSAYFSTGSNASVGAVYFGSSGVISPIVEKYLGSFTIGSTTSASVVAATITGLNCLPNSFASSIITNSGGTSQWRWPIPYIYF